MKGTFPCKVLAVYMAGIVACNAGDWYESEKRSCEFESLVAISPPFTLAKTTAGGYYYSIPKSDLNKVLIAPNGAVRTATTMSTSDIAMLKAKVQGLAAGPQAASAALAMASEIADFTGINGLATGALLGWLSSKAGTTQANVDRLVDFITTGGEAGYDIAFRNTPVGSKPLALVMTTYQVQVGDEPTKRKWLFSTCLLPVEVVLSEVITTAVGPYANNKRFNRTADGTWTQWDITDSKFDSNRFKYIKQDIAYAYFDDATVPGRQMRISMYGGSVESKSSGGDWKTLYSTTDSR